MNNISDLRRGMKRAADVFADHPDVTLVGIGEKHSDGINTRNYALIVYVEKKGQPRGSAIPKQFDAGQFVLPTDVIELPTGSMMMTNAQLDGADVLIDAANDRQGTLGFLAFEDGGSNSVFGITNSHVVARTGEDASGRQISAYLNGQRVAIGEVAHNTVLHDDGRLNKPDVALIALNNTGKAFATTYQIEPWANQPIKGVSSLSAAPQAGSRLRHEYASKATGSVSTNFGDSPFEVTNLPMISPDTGQRIYFERAFHTRTAGSVTAGHSGSAITRLTSNGNARLLAGLVVGGSGRDLFAFAWHDIAATIKNEFGVDF